MNDKHTSTHPLLLTPGNHQLSQQQPQGWLHHDTPDQRTPGTSNSGHLPRECLPPGLKDFQAGRFLFGASCWWVFLCPDSHPSLWILIPFLSLMQRIIPKKGHTQASTRRVPGQEIRSVTSQGTKEKEATRGLKLIISWAWDTEPAWGGGVSTASQTVH